MVEDCFLRAAGIMVGGSGGPGQRVVAERRWRLGVHSRGHPHRIIEDLLRALTAQRVAYKKTATPYNYKCRKVYPALGMPHLPQHLSASDLCGTCLRIPSRDDGMLAIALECIVQLASQNNLPHLRSEPLKALGLKRL